ncbi:MAG TPA: hypothetical protein VKG61_09925 [Streptosporangiaceae bacterium]|nr:hypothetical protein [Streptosporangiaceae bacterium]
MGPDGLGDPGAAGDLAGDPGGAVTVQPVAVRARKTGPAQRSPMARSIARAARSERDGDDLPALAGNRQDPVPALDH